MKEIVKRDIPQVKKLLLDVLSEPNYVYIERLGGLTNHSYKVELEDERAYVVRLPGEGTEELINRSNEQISTQLACDLGIDAQMLYFGATGEKISCYINGAQTMCSDSFSNTEILRKAATVFRVLHTCNVDTGVSFDVFEMASDYERIINNYAISKFDDYEEVKMQVMRIRSYINKHTTVTYVPCHNDPLCENWILGGNGKLYLVDWEYAGMNDSMWDLADLSIEANLSEVQDKILLQHYFGRNPEQEEKMRFYANKLYLDFLWALWGKTRVPFDGEAMEEYALERYIRLKNNLTNFLDIFPIEQQFFN